jgi:hypothetical protein
LSEEEQGVVAERLRTKTVNSMRDSHHHLLPLALASADAVHADAEAYLSALEDGSEWPGETELAVISARLGIVLTVHQRGQAPKRYSPGCESLAADPRRHVHLLFTRAHYDLIVTE